MKRRLLVISEDPVGGEMGGNAIRAFELARVLGEHVEVTLAAPSSEGPPASLDAGIEQVPFDRDDPRALSRLLRGIDVVLTLPQGPAITSVLRRSGARLVYDLYDPKALQVLEAHAAAPPTVRRFWSTIALDHLLEALSTGDFFLCASERQRDLWIGTMLGSRLITPALYEDDPTLRTLLDVVPFGVSAEPPRAVGEGPFECFPALERSAEVVLWNGGLWSWLDPAGAVEAIARVVERRPGVRLVFMGRPPQDPRQAAAAAAARASADRHGLSGRVVFFNDRWVPYAERADWLLRADCALSMHVEHLETRFSFRTRLLDCFWAGLPAVCTGGDELAELVAREGLGATVAPGDHDGAAAAIEEVLERGRSHYRDALARVASEHLWPRVAGPLVGFLADDAGHPPRRRPSPLASPGRWLRGGCTRAARTVMRGLARR